jgi:CDGSH iron-sulfur domain-containing protein 3
MSEPNRPNKQPYVVKLAPGAYYWCACGRSRRQPYCDGSHRSTLVTPVKIEPAETVEVKLCGCKELGKRPYCDCMHQRLEGTVSQSPRPGRALVELHRGLNTYSCCCSIRICRN